MSQSHELYCCTSDQRILLNKEKGTVAPLPGVECGNVPWKSMISPKEIFKAFNTMVVHHSLIGVTEF
jgi:hypothetical protein